MKNTAWECTRCGTMNAPFNPACCCKPKGYHDDSEEKIPDELSPHLMDAARYLNTDELSKILEGEKRKAELAIGLMPNFYNSRCSICNEFHTSGQACATL